MSKKNKPIVDFSKYVSVFIFLLAVFIGVRIADKPKKNYSYPNPHPIPQAVTVPEPDVSDFNESQVEPEDPNLATNIFIVFDDSGSMAEGNRIGKAQEAMKNYLKALSPHVNCGLMTFDGNGSPLVRENLVLSETAAPLKEKVKTQRRIESIIQTLRPSGATPLNLCLNVAGEVLLKRKIVGPYERQVILMVTDGGDTISGKEMVAKTMEQLTSSGIEINLIAFETQENNYLQSYSTRFYQPNNTEELTKALKETLSEAGTFTSFSASH